MPIMESQRCTVGSAVTAEFVQNELSIGADPLLLDCRAQSDYNMLHIEGSMNVSVPSLMLRRLKKGALGVSCVIQSNEAKERFHRKRFTQSVIVYDDTTDINSSSSCIVSLLMKRLRDEGCRPCYLQGGFSTFKRHYPDFCVKGDEEQSLHNTILGLSNLNIVSSDRDSESSTPTDLYPVEVIPNLYLGNARSSENLDILEKHGIKYILNVTSNVPNVFEKDDDFKYMQIPISDHWSQNLSVFFPEAIAFIDEARQKNSGVLVHCLAGVSRSVTVTVAYLMQKLNMSLNDAYDMLKKVKPNISPNFNFMGQLLDFERLLNSPKDVDTESSYFTTPTKSSPNYELERPSS